MVSLSAGALLLAFIITLLEMTEVVALVFALRGESETIRHAAGGAIAGTALVAAISVGAGAVLLDIQSQWLLLGSAAVLYGFAVFLFRSTRRSYRKLWHPSPAGAGAAAPTGRSEQISQFGTGFTVGVVESIETVIVLLSIAGAGQAPSAVIGALVAGGILVAAALALHGQIRKIKVPWLKLGATSMLFAFAVFWTGEAAGLNWPYADLSLVPLFAVAILVIRPIVGYLEGDPARDAAPT
ncbi:MAG TPA: hypothetical protein VGV89_01710 [Thermoplasmata archaeon]|nr:hypothetical protein [Thermoplasmata archaeon]